MVGLRRMRVGMVAVLLAGTSLVLAGCFSGNTPPTAFFKAHPSTGDAPLSVFFDGGASFDVDGTIASFSWVFGDGAEATGPTVTHTYAKAGAYVAGLTIADDRGATADTERTVFVNAPGEEIPPGNQVGDAAPEFTLETLDGNPLSLSDLLGQIVLLDFWASDCSPCRQTLPWLHTLLERFRDDGLVLVGVSQDDNASDIRRFVEDNGYDQMITLWESPAASDAVADLYGVSLIPHTFVIDRQGIIRHRDHPIRIRDYHIEPWL